MSVRTTLKVALLQTELAWEDVEYNLQMAGRNLSHLPADVDLVVLPEMFSTGFTMSPQKVAEENSGRTMTLIRQFSEDKGLAICGSFAATEADRYFNRFFWISDGDFEHQYDKRHLFRMAQENKVYTQGEEDQRIDFKGWKIMPRICYDLRFPVWSRSNDVDLQIYVANWPSMRVDAWDKLLLARAIENQCYVIGVNRIGKDGNEVPYSGHSVVIGPKGNAITTPENEEEGWIIASIDLEELRAFRKAFPVGLDADQFEIIP
ncbi:MAG: amidohydrolase [Flavobacteriales bacterium]|nr:amidohydrolase [Flavobacteriales bacterium]